MALLRIGRQKIVTAEVRIKPKVPCCKCGKSRLEGIRMRWLMPADKVRTICNVCISEYIEKAPESSLSGLDVPNPAMVGSEYYLPPTDVWAPVDTKVWKLGRLKGLNSKTVLAACDDLGYIKGHMSTILASDIEKINERLKDAVK
jgi:hypothetical protein